MPEIWALSINLGQALCFSCFCYQFTATAGEAPPILYNRAVPDTLVHDLVEDLSTSWRMLGRRLGLAEGVLKNVDSEHRRVIEKGVAMFDEWKNRKTTDATMQALRDGLEKIGRRDLSEKARGTQTFLYFVQPNLCS